MGPIKILFVGIVSKLLNKAQSSFWYYKKLRALLTVTSRQIHFLLKNDFPHFLEGVWNFKIMASSLNSTKRFVPHWLSDRLRKEALSRLVTE